MNYIENSSMARCGKKQSDGTIKYSIVLFSNEKSYNAICKYYDKVSVLHS